MTWRDIAVLADLDAALFGDDAWAAPTWWAELASRPRRDYVVAVAEPADAAVEEPGGDNVGVENVGVENVGVENGSVVGYAGLDHGGDSADVMTVAVVPVWRGRGLGDVLLDDLVRRAGGRGATALMLEVRADNAAALRLYGRHGFERVAVRRRYYQPGDVDALVMRRQVAVARATGDRSDAT